MFANLREKQSFESDLSDKDNFSQKEKASTKNPSSCKTISSDFNEDFCSGQQQRKKANSVLINSLMQRIKKMQKAQNEAKQKFQICISTLSKQIAMKDTQNKKINDQIQGLRSEIAQQKRDLEVIKTYTSKLNTKVTNSTTLKKSKQEKKSSPVKEIALQSKEKPFNKSHGKLFKKASLAN